MRRQPSHRGRKKGLMNWLIPRAYFLYIVTCLKLIAEFILIFCHCLLLLIFALDVPFTAFLGGRGQVRVGVKINSTVRIRACFVQSC